MEAARNRSVSSRLTAHLLRPTSPARRRFLRAALGLGGALVALRAGQASADPIDYHWLTTSRATPLRLNPAGTEVRWLRKGTLLRVAMSANGPRLWAWCPAFAAFGSVDASAVEDAAAPTEYQLLAQRMEPVLPPTVNSVELPARVVGSGKLRTWPDPRPDTLVRDLYHNAELWVVELVQGDDGEPWYRLADSVMGSKAQRGAAYFMHHSFVRLPRTDFHPTLANPDRVWRQWFEADLKTPALLTAYERGRAVWSSMALHGLAGNLTPRGEHKVLWRVARETMTSERTYPPIPRGAPGGYYVENVLYTQYFSRNGAAIHYNYWSANWGYQGSHGCLGLPLAESKWCWDWSPIGTPVKVFA
jgi:hypothetical protein